MLPCQTLSTNNSSDCRVLSCGTCQNSLQLSMVLQGSINRVTNIYSHCLSYVSGLRSTEFRGNYCFSRISCHTALLYRHDQTPDRTCIS